MGGAHPGEQGQGDPHCLWNLHPSPPATCPLPLLHKTCPQIPTGKCNLESLWEEDGQQPQCAVPPRGVMAELPAALTAEPARPHLCSAASRRPRASSRSTLCSSSDLRSRASVVCSWACSWRGALAHLAGCSGARRAGQLWHQALLGRERGLPWGLQLGLGSAVVRLGLVKLRPLHMMGQTGGHPHPAPVSSALGWLRRGPPGSDWATQGQDGRVAEQAWGHLP